ncbi:MAG: DivIVA domain-containing protein [Clostridia bacterium]
MQELDSRISNARFDVCLKGYLPKQVDSFLDSLREQARQMTEQLAELNDELDRYHKMESDLALLLLKVKQVAADQEQLSEKARNLAVADQEKLDEDASKQAASHARAKKALQLLYTENERLKLECKRLNSENQTRKQSGVDAPSESY